MKYLKTFKYTTLGTGDDSFERMDTEPTDTDGEDLGEHAAVIGFAQQAIEQSERSFPNVHPSIRAGEFQTFENLKYEEIHQALLELQEAKQVNIVLVSEVQKVIRMQRAKQQI